MKLSDIKGAVSIIVDGDFEQKEELVKILKYAGLDDWISNAHFPVLWIDDRHTIFMDFPLDSVNHWNETVITATDFIKSNTQDNG